MMIRMSIVRFMHDRKFGSMTIESGGFSTTVADCLVCRVTSNDSSSSHALARALSYMPVHLRKFERRNAAACLVVAESDYARLGICFLPAHIVVIDFLLTSWTSNRSLQGGFALPTESSRWEKLIRKILVP